MHLHARDLFRAKTVQNEFVVYFWSSNFLKIHVFFLFQPFWLQKHVFLFTQNLDMNTLTISLGFSS